MFTTALLDQQIQKFEIKNNNIILIGHDIENKGHK